ncbi:DNA cytosine methyltransferase [Escherichia coli]|uniref:DNA cytosine methyltransferase n=1 Tax=Escherichia TaxID=561 RepID=UPI000CF6EE87|nr:MULTISPECIES: DNA cytosine methyltransferase [unclassified Escherichia]EFC0650253.1 DNA cytosine methyltransferase [Escherichia coli]EFD5001977.1 DNA cytosine methyltransferase [Escherichia coli]MDQ9286424.1 DNA cytosine methyltransferase [Escherichia marmotae]MEC9642358.1 DNA cytosine methyltransferase [Escherichia marmotae]
MSTTLTVSEAASILGISPQRVRSLCREGKIPSARQSGKIWLLESSNIIELKNLMKDEDRMSKIETTKPIALSFFSGAMGLDLGLEKAGFKTLLACEIDKSARKTIKKNKPDMALIGDIRDYSSQEILEHAGLSLGDEVDLIMGGPPCQAFSTAGKRLGFEDERGNVFLKYLETVFEIRPRYFIIENVRGLLSAPLQHRPHSERGEDFPPLKNEEQAGGVLSYIYRMIKANGYSCSFELYNAANFGVPQTRERVVMLCSRDGRKIPYLEPTHSQAGEFGLPVWKTFAETVADLNGIHHTHLDFPEKRKKYYRMLGPGEYWKNLPIELQKEALGNSFFSGGGKTGFLRRLSWDKPSPTLVTHPAMPATDLAHPEEVRPLSIEEYKKLQQFPDSWAIEGKLLDQYKQLGNAVPVGLGYAIGKHLINFDNGILPKKYPGFKYSRYKNTSDLFLEEKLSEQDDLDLNLAV